MAAYIRPADYAAFGIPDATDAQVEAASRMVDGELGRPEGLLWSPDAYGEPCHMTGMTPSRSYTLSQAISPGTGIALALANAQFGYRAIGEVVILDRADPDRAEACVIAAAAGNTITLQNVRLPHDIGAIAEFGLTIRQETSGRVRISRAPVARIFSAFARHDYCREMGRFSFDDYEALLVTNYGLNGVSGWNALDISAWDISENTGAIRTPPLGYEDVRLQYVAGWSYETLPSGIKQAVAALVAAASSLGAEGISGNIKVLKSGDATIERFAGAGGGSSPFDSATLKMLAPYRTYRI